MKLTIDKKQSEELKKVCEEFGVKLPKMKFVTRYGVTIYLGNDCEEIHLLQLLEWLPKEIKTIENSVFNENWYFEILFSKGSVEASYIQRGCDGTAFCDDTMPHKSVELIDALFTLFIWAIKEGFYKGVK